MMWMTSVGMPEGYNEIVFVPSSKADRFCVWLTVHSKPCSLVASVESHPWKVQLVQPLAPWLVALLDFLLIFLVSARLWGYSKRLI